MRFKMKYVVVICAGLLAVSAWAEPVEGQGLSRRSRASWLTDKRIVPVGSIVTVVVDERTTARERTSRVASANRRNSMGLTIASPDVTLPISSAQFGASSDAQSRNTGEANRRGDLSSIFTVSVVGVEPTGNLRIEGTRTIEIDGRAQEWELSGIIRPTDLSADNIVPSSRIANAEIHYKGQDIGPSKGIISKILGIFWP